MHAVASSCCFPWKNCKNVKCSPITCKLEDITLKGEYFVNVSTQIWNGTFAAVSISCIVTEDPILKYFQTPDFSNFSTETLQSRRTLFYIGLCFSRLKT